MTIPQQQYRTIKEPRNYYVEKGADPQYANGSYEHPFDTIEKALRQAFTDGGASKSSPAVINVGDGVWDERLRVRMDHLYLTGRGEDHCILRCTTGTALTIGGVEEQGLRDLETGSGVTLASFNTDYLGLSQGDGYEVMDNIVVSGISIQESDAAKYSVLLLNVGNGLSKSSDTQAQGVRFTRCRIQGSVYARNFGNLHLDGTDIVGHLESRNVEVLTTHRMDCMSATVTYDAAEDKPAGMTSSTWSGSKAYASGAVLMDGVDFELRELDAGNVHIENTGTSRTLVGGTVGNLTLVGTATLSAYGSTIRGNLVTSDPVNISATLQGCTVLGDANIGTGGTQAIVFEGGGVLGTITDPDSALSFSGGSGNLGAAEANTYYVRKGATGGNGSFAYPFGHPNDAIAQVKANGDASSANPYLIRVGEGVFEDVFFNVPYTTLQGSGVGSTIFRGTATGVGLYWGNATQVSYDAFMLADGHAEANIDTAYTTLAADGTVTTLLGGVVQDVTVESDDAANCALLKIYVGSGFDTNLELRFLERVYTPPTGGSVYIRNVAGVSALLLEVSDTLFVRNCRIGYLDFCKIQNLDGLHDSGADLPAAPWNTSTVLNTKGTYFGNTIQMDGNGGTCYLSMKGGGIVSTASLLRSGRIAAEIVHFGGNLTGDASPRFTLEGCYVDGNLTLSNPATVTLELRGTDIRGAVTIPTGGSKTCSMVGGSISGTVTDPDGSLSYTPPTLGGGGSSSGGSDLSTPPTLYWPLNEGSGLVAGEESEMGHAVDGAIDATGSSWVTGRLSGTSALQLSGADNARVDFGTNVTEVSLVSGPGWSFECWVKITGTGQAHIFGRTDASYSSGSRVFFADQSVNGHLELSISSLTTYTSNVNPINITDGAWHYIKVGFWESGLQMMVDGVRQFSQGGVNLGTDTTSFNLFLGYLPISSYTSTVVVERAQYRMLY